MTQQALSGGGISVESDQEVTQNDQLVNPPRQSTWRQKQPAWDCSDERERDYDENRAWNALNVLTFDGGGVRGYYSLLQLQNLMEYIETEELRLDKEENLPESEKPTSFSPCPEPLHVSHLKKKYTPFLPCHYFDYIAGTSTGALITIMLARLRMPAKDCLAEYRRLGGAVFGNPRVLHQVGKRGVIFKKNKFKTSILEEAIKDVIRRRGEVANDHDDAMPFTTPKGLCRAIVLANRQVDIKESTQGLFLFRSYDHFHNRHGRNDRHEVTGAPRNAGRGTRFAAWKVARAATAAKLFFKPLEVTLDDGEIIRPRRATTTFSSQGEKSRLNTRKRQGTTSTSQSDPQMPELPILVAPPKPLKTMVLTDGGFDRCNNPAEEVYREVHILTTNSNKRIHTFVSVGTARQMRPFQSGKPRTAPVVEEGLSSLGNPEPNHEKMVETSKKDGFGYYRLNQANGLRVEMDEWKPSSQGNLTLETMTQSFNRWAVKQENILMFQDCAARLVQNRRERSRNRSRWERFALGKFYVCGEENCNLDCDETWNYRDEFCLHLKSQHGIAEGAEMKAMLQRCELAWEYKPSAA